MNNLIEPDVKLSSGKIVKHRRDPKGHQIAEPEMTEAEWREYCEIRAKNSPPGAFFIA